MDSGPGLRVRAAAVGGHQDLRQRSDVRLTGVAPSAPYRPGRREWSCPREERTHGTAADRPAGLSTTRACLVTTGELATLKQAGATVRTPEPERLARLLTDAGALVHPDSEGELVVRAIETSRIGDLACSAGISLHELTPEADSLEDLFMEWTSNDNSHLGAHFAAVAETERQAVPR